MNASHLSGWATLFAAVLSLGGCSQPGGPKIPATKIEHPSEPTSKPATPFEASLRQIWSDAQINDGAEPSHAPANFSLILPQDISRTESFEAGTKPYRGLGLKIAIQNDRLAAMGKGEILKENTTLEAILRFTKALEEKGYRRVQDPAEWRLYYDRFDGFGGGYGNPDLKEESCVVRQVGDSEIVVLTRIANSSLVTDDPVGIHVRWHVSRAYPHSPPKLGELMAAAPPLLRAPFLGDKFYAELAEEPVTEIGHGDDYHSGFDLKFAGNADDRLAQALALDGFDIEREEDVNHLGYAYKWWSRYRDTTTAHIRHKGAAVESMFHCQTPQNMAPANAKRPFRHPSLKIARSKRPVVKLNDLFFADEKLKRDTELVQQLIERVIGNPVFGEHYKDARYDNAPFYSGSWRTWKGPRRNTHQDSQLPGQVGAIVLRGSWSKDQHDQIYSVDVSANYVPSEGWRAGLSYTLSDSGKGRRFYGGRAGVALIDHEVKRFGVPLPLYSLTNNYVQTQVREIPQFSYHYQVQRRLSHSELSSAATRAADARNFRALFVSPASLRDTVLAELDELRRTAEAEIPHLLEVKVTEHRTGVDSDVAEETSPAEKRPPAEDIKRQLLDNVVKELDVRSEAVRNHCEAMHASLTRALPLLELPEDVIRDDSTAP